MTEEAVETLRETRNGDGDAAVEPGAPPEPATDGSVDIEEPSLYFNRELSWLDFNERVLELAEDPRSRCWSAMRFCAIYEDNLDEFYMVRIAGMHDQVEANMDAARRRRRSRPAR